MKNKFITFLKSPIGEIKIVSSDKGVMEIKVSDGTQDGLPAGDPFGAKVQLEQYFNGTRKEFSLPLDIKVRPFTQSVYDTISKIPFGSIKTYGEIAKSLGNPNASRAVGGAMSKNPVFIVLPCHRIVGQKSLTGFAYGLDAKSWLLRHEGVDITKFL